MLEQTKINRTPIKRMREMFRIPPKVLSFKKAFFKMENGRKVIVMGDSIDTLGEIYQERARYLINTDEMLEEMHGKYQTGIADKVEFVQNKGAVCCGILIDTDEANGAEIITGEQLPVCIDNCRKFIEIANA